MGRIARRIKREWSISREMNKKNGRWSRLFCTINFTRTVVLQLIGSHYDDEIFIVVIWKLIRNLRCGPKCFYNIILIFPLERIKE